MTKGFMILISLPFCIILTSETKCGTYVLQGTSIKCRQRGESLQKKLTSLDASKACGFSGSHQTKTEVTDGTWKCMIKLGKKGGCLEKRERYCMP